MTEHRTGRAAVFRGNERGFDLLEHDVPTPDPGRVLLRMELAGICGTDAHIYETGTGAPMALGHENSGVVVAMGDGVAGDFTGRPLRLGDRIVPHPGAAGGAYGFRQNPADSPPHFTGGFGQYLSLCYPDSAIFKLDAPAEIAVLLEPCSIAVHAIDRARIRIGDTVVVQGTGAIGLLTVFLARRAGAVNVIAVGGPAGRLAWAQQLGADVVFDIADVADPATRREAILAATPGGDGADVVFECAGAKPAVAEGIDVVRTGGTFCEVGHFIDTGEIALNPNRHFVMKDLNLVAPYGSKREHFVRARAVLEKDGAPLAGLVSHRLPLDRIGEGFEALIGGYHLDGRDAIKIAVDPWLA
jgi:threonine dehydrogenase-like Zn-dependent dehydrogenase